MVLHARPHGATWLGTDSNCGADFWLYVPHPPCATLCRAPACSWQASLFRLYELAALATAACGDEDPRLIELLAALAAEVAPGSEEHVCWARRYRCVCLCARAHAGVGLVGHAGGLGGCEGLQRE